MTSKHFAMHFYVSFLKSPLRHSASSARYGAYRLLHLARVSTTIVPRLLQLPYLLLSFIQYSTNSRRTAKLINQLERTMRSLSSSPKLCLVFFPMRRPAKQLSSIFLRTTACILSPPKSWEHNIKQTETCVVKGFPISFVNSSTRWVLKAQNLFSSQRCTIPHI